MDNATNSNINWGHITYVVLDTLHSHRMADVKMQVSGRPKYRPAINYHHIQVARAQWCVGRLWLDHDNRPNTDRRALVEKAIKSESEL